MRIATLLTCYNRCEMTLRCLRQLTAQALPKDCRIDIYLVDDASPDRTGDRVDEWFKSCMEESGNFNLIVKRSDGDLYWCGGMRLAWKTAVESGEYDAYLWLNDDTMLYEGALMAIIGDCRALGWDCLVCGAFKDPQTGKLFYSATDVPNVTGSRPIESFGFLNGNLLIVPSSVYQKIGGLSGRFTHQFGDYEYSCRARKAGVRLFVAHSVLGECKANYGFDREKFCSFGFVERLKRINDPKWYGLMDFVRYKQDVYGQFSAMMSLVKGLLCVICPRLILRKGG